MEYEWNPEGSLPIEVDLDFELNVRCSAIGECNDHRCDIERSKGPAAWIIEREARRKHEHHIIDVEVHFMCAPKALDGEITTTHAEKRHAVQLPRVDSRHRKRHVALV